MSSLIFLFQWVFSSLLEKNLYGVSGIAQKTTDIFGWPVILDDIALPDVFLVV